MAEDPFAVRVDDFEGPLDLLLHLVRRHQVAVEELPLARITGEYLDVLRFMQSIELEPASEFLELAATLVRLKARSLLPRATSIEDDDSGSEEVVLLQQLVEHQVVRMAARRLRGREVETAAVWFRSGDTNGDAEPRAPEVVEADIFTLVTAFRHLLEELEVPDRFEIGRDEYPVAGCIAEIREQLQAREPVPFERLFQRGEPRAKLISLFLALLELIRSAEARALQDGPLGKILIVPIATPAGS